MLIQYIFVPFCRRFSGSDSRFRLDQEKVHALEPTAKLLRPASRRGLYSDCREDVIQALNQALRAADPKSILRQKIKLKGSKLTVDSVKLDLSQYERVLVIGG